MSEVETPEQENLIQISEARLKELLRCELKMILLEQAGVEEWENYDDVIRQFRQEREEFLCLHL